MSGWYFALGCFAGSLWTLLVARFRHLPRLRWPSFKSKYAALTIGDTETKKIQAIKEIRAVTGYSLYEAKQVSEGRTIVLDRDSAHDLAARLRGLGIESVLRPMRKKK